MKPIYTFLSWLLSGLLFLSIKISNISFIIFIYNNNKVLPRFKCFNSRSPLPFPIDLEPHNAYQGSARLSLLGFGLVTSR
ncbi:hypothetical protein HanRHA438_Chr05g0238601 [Helianthus annuus]|nr:hypothetical protein HanRHA438_Chr05g0238601 [Helianthus annuus]